MKSHPMKSFLLCLAFTAFAAPLLAQQDSTQPVVQKADERVMFQSTVRELTSYLKENNERAAGTVFNNVTDAMQSFINETKAAIDTASGDEKRNLKNKLDRQRQLMMQFQSFQSNLIRNRSSIETWAEQFIKTLYP